MTLQGDISAALPGLRAAAESRMTATCTVSREDPAGEPNWNADTMQYEPPVTTVYSGSCRVRAAVKRDIAATVADQVFIESQYILHLPMDGSEEIRRGDLVEITASPDDGALIGRLYTIVSAAAGSQNTARRFPVRETQ